MTTTQSKAGKVGGPGRYTLAADDWYQPAPTADDANAEVHHRRGDAVTLDAANAERLWRAGALVAAGDPLPSRESVPSPVQVLYTEALERQAADAEAFRQRAEAAQAAHARYIAAQAEEEIR